MNTLPEPQSSRTKVLVVDDSAVLRRVLTDELSKYGDLEVVGSAIDPYVARDKIVRLRPDVLTLDLEMPRMDGLSFLSKLMKYFPLPVVIVSSLAPENSPVALRALRMGAVEVVGKPSSRFSTPDIVRLVRAIRTAAQANLDPSRHDRRAEMPATGSDPLEASGRILAIGASTGGIRAIEGVLSRVPGNAPGTVIVQHMPEGFTRYFAESLDKVCKLRVREARQGDALVPGLALVAPGNPPHALAKKRNKLPGTAYGGSPRASSASCRRPPIPLGFKASGGRRGRRAPDGDGSRRSQRIAGNERGGGSYHLSGQRLLRRLRDAQGGRPHRSGQRDRPAEPGARRHPQGVEQREDGRLLNRRRISRYEEIAVATSLRYNACHSASRDVTSQIVSGGLELNELSKQQLFEAVEGIFDSMLGLQVEPAPGAAAVAPGVRVTSSVSLTGDWNGSILLECSGYTACALAGTLLMTECPQVDEDVRDVLGEIANMVAGNVSRKLAGSTSISLPSVVTGSHYTVDVLKGEKLVDLPLYCRNQLLLVSLIRATTR